MIYSAIHRMYRSLREEWHEQRVRIFLELMRPRRGARVLDLGGGEGELMARVQRLAELDVTIADIDTGSLAKAQARGFSTVLLEEGQGLPFVDGAFDIVVCNSVIEHVTVPKGELLSRTYTNAEWNALSFRSQKEFASEIRRIARAYFVQTPHRAFPIESHTWLPFVGWLPHNATVRVVRISDRLWAKQCGHVDWNLLGPEAMRTLFPECEIHVERTLGLPKSLIAARTDRSCAG